MTRNPWKEAFLSANIKFVLIATIAVLGEGVVWYSGQFWALYFLQQVSKVDALTTAYIVGAGLIIGTQTLIFFGWLSDHIDRKPVILGGFLLAAITYYPLYLWLGSATQPGAINYPIAIIIVAILVAYVGMVYGPIGAFLAEYFPARIRYTSVSVPYHIGNGWGGGLMPFITTAAYQATGSLGAALIYPIAVPAVCFVLSLFLMPETHKMSIWEPEAQNHQSLLRKSARLSRGPLRDFRCNDSLAETSASERGVCRVRVSFADLGGTGSLWLRSRISAREGALEMIARGYRVARMHPP
jgi:MFS family permease